MTSSSPASTHSVVRTAPAGWDVAWALSQLECSAEMRWSVAASLVDAPFLRDIARLALVRGLSALFGGNRRFAVERSRTIPHIAAFVEAGGDNQAVRVTHAVLAGAHFSKQEYSAYPV
jgi:hypothetical protein